MNNGLVGRLTSSLLALFEAARQGGISYLAESLAAAAENAANEDAAEIEGGEYEGGEYDGGEFDGGEDEGGENDESADDEAKDGAEGGKPENVKFEIGNTRTASIRACTAA